MQICVAYGFYCGRYQLALASGEMKIVEEDAVKKKCIAILNSAGLSYRKESELSVLQYGDLIAAKLLVSCVRIYSENFQSIKM